MRDGDNVLESVVVAVRDCDDDSVVDDDPDAAAEALPVMDTVVVPLAVTDADCVTLAVAALDGVPVPVPETDTLVLRLPDVDSDTESDIVGLKVVVTVVVPLLDVVVVNVAVSELVHDGDVDNVGVRDALDAADADTLGVAAPVPLTVGEADPVAVRDVETVVDTV